MHREAVIALGQRGRLMSKSRRSPLSGVTIESDVGISGTSFRPSRPPIKALLILVGGRAADAAVMARHTHVAKRLSYLKPRRALAGNLLFRVAVDNILLYHRSVGNLHPVSKDAHGAKRMRCVCPT